ncbi:hypothetical protein ABH900_002081 [Stenotrophomonas sp. AN71]|uniref:hypothetical protein n=1 Tax=Stenotrophomonas sp. AN71 TaxID=3156253 RepID=UPI003D22CAA2
MTFVVFNRLHLSIAALLLSGCGNANDNGGPTAASNMPSIHLDQRAETLVDGRNAARTSYQQALSDCQAAGLPTRALSDADVARLGTIRYEAWLSSDEEVFRTREWRLLNDGPSTSCQFRLETTGLQEAQSASGLEQVDLATGEHSRSPADSDGLARFAADADEASASPGFRRAGNRKVAGQPCNEWNDENGRFRQCVWSAGAPWGFTPGALNDYRPSRYAIVLEQEPLDGNGIRLTTQRMTVGQPFERSELAVPREPSSQQ